jgi:hypothetical protein
MGIFLVLDASQPNGRVYRLASGTWCPASGFDGSRDRAGCSEWKGRSERSDFSILYVLRTHKIPILIKSRV